MKREWWQGFFGREVGEMMFASKTLRLTRREVDTVLDRARPPKNGHILDVACGQGRHLVELARRGYRVTGIDYSSRYLATARRNIRRAGAGRLGNVVRGDMRFLRRHFEAGSFDLAVFLFNSFGFFDRRSDDRRVLREIARVLKPGGGLVLNTMNRSGAIHSLVTVPAKVRSEGLHHWEETRPGVFWLDSGWYDEKRRRLEGKWAYLDVKRRKIMRFSLHVNTYTRRELREMLSRAGLKAVKSWGMLSGAGYHKHSWHETIVARKVR